MAGEFRAFGCKHTQRQALEDPDVFELAFPGIMTAEQLNGETYEHQFFPAEEKYGPSTNFDKYYGRVW